MKIGFASILGWIFVVGLLGVPTVAESACGAGASSCKSCHKVKMPVNSKGDYHVEHAFGDFCVFCHSGNTAAPDQEEAHQGMVKPLADLQKSCAACHPDDYEKLAEGYGAASASTIGSGPEASASTEEASALPPPTPDPSQVAPEDLVDYNQLLTAGSQEEQATPVIQEVSEKQEEKAVVKVSPEEDKGESESVGSNVPVVLGLIVFIGVVLLFTLFRKKSLS